MTTDNDVYEGIILTILELHKHQREHYSSVNIPILPFVEARFGRRLGATTFIKNNAKSYDIVIVKNYSLKTQMLRDACCGPKVLTEEEFLFYNKHKGLRPERVWVDSPCLLNKHDIFLEFPLVDQIIFL